VIARPLFLVVDPDGITAAGADDRVERVAPEQLAELARDVATATVPVPAVAPGDVVRAVVPLVLAVTDEGVLAWSPVEAARIPVGADELTALAQLGGGAAADGPVGIALSRLVALGVLESGPPAPAGDDEGYLRVIGTAGDEVASSPVRAGAVGVHMVCASHIAGVPLGLGMLAAAITVHDDGRLLDTFDLRPLRRETATTLAEVQRSPEPALFLFSNYLWSAPENLELSGQVKALAPGSVTVHGGPSTPKYPEDVARFLDEHPHVDIMVLGEGERTVVEVLERLGAGLDVDAVAGVPGTIVRTSHGQVVRGPERERIADLGELPSPYLMGLFDHLDGGLLDLMPLETNRGCPYGCTFCDWGSATMSRVRSFPIERVVAELEWIARRGVGTVFIADANFGILPRDLELARELVGLRTHHGAPRTVLVSFAKNQTLRAAEIVRTWIDGGIVTEGSIALQSSDEQTLEIIRRRNIRVERYDELTEAFREMGLPLAVDLMLGLPGSTVESFTADLQRCIDGELTARIYPTVVLPNSPMNDPAYRTEHAIRTDAAGVVIGSASFDDAAYAEMLRVRRRYRAADHFGVLRHVARWVQHDHGVAATELLDLIGERTSQDPAAWPSLLWICQHLPRWTVPPAGWPPLLDEVRRLLVDDLALPEGPAMDTALAVQEAHLPWPGRPMPERRELPHDYVAWFEALQRGEWAPLASFGPGVIEVSDPRGICSVHAGAHLRHHPHPDLDSVMLNEFWIADDWELSSPVARRLPQVLAHEVQQTPKGIHDVGAVP
jgi:radical SAM superfamily enzyme YgiQ (UPF0313 family)